MNAEFCNTPTLYAITVSSSNTEYSLPLTKQVKKVRIQCRDATDIRLAFEANKVSGSTDPYHTVKSGTVFEQSNLFWNNPTIYVAAGSGSKVVEVLVWE